MKPRRQLSGAAGQARQGLGKLLQGMQARVERRSAINPAKAVLKYPASFRACRLVESRAPRTDVHFVGRCHSSSCVI